MPELCEAERKRDERRHFISDMAEVLAIPAGCRMMKRILASLGYGSYLTVDAASIANFNFAMALVANMLQANEDAANGILNQILWEKTSEENK